jgi:hypothetical protein
MGVPSRTSASTPALDQTYLDFRSSSGRCAPSRHQAEGHPQVLIIAPDGIGLVATCDGTVIQMRQGDTVYTPPGEDHWHGATATNMMCHLSMFEGIGDSDGVTWHKPVTDDEYLAANSGSS